MIFNSVAEIYEAIDGTRIHLKRRLAELTDEQKSTRADENGWSVAEIVEHLGTVENGVVRIGLKLLSEAENSGALSSDGIFDPPISFVEQARSIKDKKLQAPERVHPKGVQSLEESYAKLDENRRALAELRPRIETTDVSAPKFPHPFFGNLNLYQWLAVVAMHEARHLRQIETILQETSAA